MTDTERTQRPERLPDGLLVAFYGDDFTGSTDVMEVMTFAGLPTVLFLDVPTDAQRARFAGYRGIGIAGTARSRTPEWMDHHLPRAFAALKDLSAPIVHYKICSTFDSAPHIGSIGRAIDIAMPIVGNDWTVLVVAAPRLRRYQAFGNLFAAVDGVGYRLDRHPTMARHPVTPMGEADVRRHLSEQTERPIGLVDLLALKAARGADALADARRAGAEIIAIDVIDDETLRAAGELIWRHRGQALFAASSSGLQYALIAHWRAAGLLAAEPPPQQGIGTAERTAVVSGSCSPVTGAQVDWAIAQGFVPVPIDTAKAADRGAWGTEVGRCADAALSVIGEGGDPIVFTARGPSDPAIARHREAAEAAGAGADVMAQRVGEGLGDVLLRLIGSAGVRRVTVAGGDTSGFASARLGLWALTALAPAAPGGPICCGYVDEDGGETIEISLKGGQVGGPDYFGIVKAGGAA